MKNKIEVVKGFKGFDKGLKCRDFQYEVGKTYTKENEIKLCGNGFHFCKAFKDVDNFYSFRNDDNVFAEVEAFGQVIDDNDMSKSVTNNIKIVRIIEKEEMLNILNIGKGNTGFLNTGDWNTGDRNTGDRNTGYSNTGDWNTGYRNTGYRNTGDSNTGYRNTGDSNTGYRNTGDWNKTNGSSGVFCTEEPKMIMFNKKTDMTFDEWRNTRAYDLLCDVDKSVWIYPDNMTDEDKKKNPSWETVGGYLKEIPRAEASKKWWTNLSNYDKAEMFNLPNFNLKIFNEIMELEITTKEHKEVLKNVGN